MTAAFDVEQARTQIEKRVAATALLRDSDIAHVPDLDVAGLYAFSVMPHSTGLAGEVIWLIGPNETLSAGTAFDFDNVMRRLGIGTHENAMDVPKFAHLFLRLRVLRHGELLEKPEGHPLLKPGTLPAREFSAPRYEFGPHGAHYSFWVFDTDSYVPVFWDVQVGPDGTTTFSEEQK